jgi:hypothetical protein
MIPNRVTSLVIRLHEDNPSDLRMIYINPEDTREPNYWRVIAQ